MDVLKLIGDSVAMIIGLFSLLTWISKVLIIFALNKSGSEVRDLPYAEAFLVSTSATYFFVFYLLK